MDNLPIDIHSNKLLDWLISRRHCSKDWQDSIELIKRKVSSAIEDMPEHEAVVRLLQATYINYFHCKEILEILKVTEKDSKNIFGYYSSQRMKDWQEIISVYEKGNVYLAEAAQLLQRFVQYEIPALRRQIARLEHDIEDAAKKEVEYEKLAVDNMRQYERELAQWKVKGSDLKSELLELVSSELPSFVGATFSQLKQLKDPICFYVKFAGYFNGDKEKEESVNESAQLLPLLRLIIRSESVPLVYEWLHGLAPQTVDRPYFLTAENSKDTEYEIDFGDDEEQINFDITIEESGRDGGNEASNHAASSVVDNQKRIARGEEAYSVLENPKTLSTVLAELNELAAFLKFRKIDEFDENSSDVYLSGICELPSELTVKLPTLEKWMATIEITTSSLKEPRTRHLMKVWTSPIYADELVNRLGEKQRLHAKYQKFKTMMGEKSEKLSREVRTSQQLLSSMIEAAKYLQDKVASNSIQHPYRSGA